MKITFCIKGCATKPIGGHKVLYELANRLAKRGYDITIVFPSMDNLYQLHLPVDIRVFICKVLTDYLHIMPTWFKFGENVKIKTVKDYSEKNFPDSDFIVATAYETASPVFKLPSRCGKKIYFIQDYETWGATEKEINETFSLGMKNITISNWLKLIVQNYSIDEVACIPNAIDIKVFNIKKNIEDRSEPVIGLLYHPGEHKGLKYAFEALNIVKEVVPNLRVKMFGAPKKPKGLPNWYEYHYRIKQDDLSLLYNECNLFVCATVNEGFGLTGAESMACGCAFVSTAYKGVHEYAIDGKNALLSPICDSKRLAENIIFLLENKEKRIEYAYEGYKSIQKRDWEIVLDKFLEILENL